MPRSSESRISNGIHISGPERISDIRTRTNREEVIECCWVLSTDNPCPLNLLEQHCIGVHPPVCRCPHEILTPLSLDLVINTPSCFSVTASFSTAYSIGLRYPPAPENFNEKAKDHRHLTNARDTVSSRFNTDT